MLYLGLHIGVFYKVLVWWQNSLLKHLLTPLSSETIQRYYSSNQSSIFCNQTILYQNTSLWNTIINYWYHKNVSNILLTVTNIFFLFYFLQVRTILLCCGFLFRFHNFSWYFLRTIALFQFFRVSYASYDIQLCRLVMAPLVIKHYWNEVILTGQNPPLNCCQHLELFTAF